MAHPVSAYAREGIVAFSVHITWDPAAKKGRGGKRSLHPTAWPSAGGFVDAQWNSVAINTELSKLVVVDFDDDRALGRLGRAQPGPDRHITREARSGRASAAYFRAIEGLPPVKSTDNIAIFGMERGASKVDVKAAGGLIYAPPSAYTMPDGSEREYVWANDLEIAPLPRALYDLLPKKDELPVRARAPTPIATNAPARSRSKRKRGPRRRRRTFALIAKLDAARASGGRNSDWLRVGMALKRNGRSSRARTAPTRPPTCSPCSTCLA